MIADEVMSVCCWSTSFRGEACHIFIIFFLSIFLIYFLFYYIYLNQSYRQTFEEFMRSVAYGHRYADKVADMEMTSHGLGCTRIMNTGNMLRLIGGMEICMCLMGWRNVSFCFASPRYHYLSVRWAAYWCQLGYIVL